MIEKPALGVAHIAARDHAEFPVAFKAKRAAAQIVADKSDDERAAERD
jgi:hypothetical protein